MSKMIEQAMMTAIRDALPFRSANTTYDPVTGTVVLHGNAIAQREAGGWKFNLCGWNTPTTRSRLNAISRVYGLPRIHTKAGAPLADGQPIPSNDWFWPS